MRHLLVTNDYPPKVGGIQVYLWEIYRRLPQHEIVVLTRPYPGHEAFDAEQQHQVVRTRQPVLLPEPWLARQINDIVARQGIDLVMYDPAVPVGLLGPRLSHPYGVILHGAEVTIPGRVVGTKQLIGDVLRQARLVVTAGEYSTQEAERAAGRPLPVAVVPPGVDIDRFRPLGPDDRRSVRAQYGLADDAEVVLTLSRLVPRKGMDTTIRAIARLAATRPNIVLLIAGTGRDRRRLERLAGQLQAPVRFLDRVADEAMPGLYAAADVFSMLCRVRWGGLEQEGFGIVFVEAAAAGTPQIAGHSGGAAEAVADGLTGLVIDPATNDAAAARAIAELLDNPALRQEMSDRSRQRAVGEFSYDLLAKRFHDALVQTIGELP